MKIIFKYRGVLILVALALLTAIIITALCVTGEGIEFIPDNDSRYCYSPQQLKSSKQDFINVFQACESIEIAHGQNVSFTTNNNGGDEKTSVLFRDDMGDFSLNDLRKDKNGAGIMNIYVISNTLNEKWREIAPEIILYEDGDIEIYFKRKCAVFNYFIQMENTIRLQYFIEIKSDSFT